MKITEKEELNIKETLGKISAAMKGQDNWGTAHPIFIVQQRCRIYGIDPQWTDDIVWVCDGSEMSEDDPDLPKVIAEYEELGDLSPKYENWVRTGYKDTWDFIQPFFSERAAAEYIAANRHNLKDPRIYVDSAYRNPEWQAIEAVLLSLIEKEVSDDTI